MDGLTRAEVERVRNFAKASKSLAGLRPSEMIRLMRDCLLGISEAVARFLKEVKVRESR